MVDEIHRNLTSTQRTAAIPDVNQSIYSQLMAQKDMNQKGEVLRYNVENGNIEPYRTSSKNGPYRNIQ